jgi:ketosteroid isomerase-like protein
MTVASNEERERIARAGFEALNKGDYEALLTLFSEDVEIFSTPELANPGRFHGRDGFLKWIEPWTDAWEALDMEVIETTPVGEQHVVAEVHQAAQGRAGIEVSMDVAFVFDVQNGRVGYVALMATAEQAVELARERESG